MRDRLIFCAALLAFAFASLAAGFTAREKAFETRGYEDATRSADLPYRQPLLGANGDWLKQPRARLDAELERLREANVTWLRQRIPWAEIETARGRYEWAEIDALIDALRKWPELRLVAWLTNAPTWLPDDEYPAAFARFAADFAARYGDVIDHYQLGEAPPQAAHYAATLAAAYPAIHAADTHALVLTAPLRPPNDLTYLNELYVLGAHQNWDALSAAHGAYETPPLDRRADSAIVNYSRLVLLRELMREQGDRRRALWLTDFDWPEATQEEQILYYEQALARAAREWPWLGALFLPANALEEPSQLEALRAIPASAPHNGLFHMQHEAARYSGEWSFAGDAADYGRVGDSELYFTYYGRDIAILLHEDAWHTVLYARIDGAAANALPPAAEERGYLILTSADRSPQRGLTALARDLPLAEHELQLIGGGGDTHFALLGIAISSGNLAAPYVRQLSLAALTMSLAAAFAFVSALPMLRPIWRRIVAYRVSLRSEGVATTAERPPSHRAAAGSFALATMGYVLLQAQLALPLTLLICAALLALFVWRRELGLALILLALPFHQYPIALGGLRFPPAELLLVLTLMAELLHRLLRWRQTLRAMFVSRYQVLDAATLLWVVLGALTLLWARWPAPAMTEWRALLLEPALFYVLLRQHARAPATQQRLVASLLLGACLVAALGIVQLLSGALFVSAEGGARRLLSVYGSPNHVALFLGRCIPFALVLWLYARPSGIRRLGAAVTILLLAAAILTQSFAALLLGLPVGFLVVTLAGRHRHARYLGGGIVALLLLAMLLGGRLNAWWNWQEGSLFTRANVWQSALQMLADEPIRGFGLDQFLYAYRDTYIAPDAWRDPDLSHPHNFLLDIWLRLGILGVALFAVLQWRFWRQISSAIRALAAARNWRSMLALATAGAMANLLAHGLVDNSIFVHDLAFIFALLLALVYIPAVKTAAPA